MTDLETVPATSGDQTGTFELDWDHKAWSSAATHEEAAFPFIAEIRGKRYELYSNGRFDEEELSEDDRA